MNQPEPTPRPRRYSRRSKTLTMLQMEAAECGAACLGMILGNYGKHVPLSELRRECGVSRDGVKASNIVRAARKYGLKAAGFNMGLEDLYKTKLPVILYWEFDHFVILEGFNRRGALINDPAVGHREIPYADFGKSFTGVVLTFEKDEGFEKGGRRFNMLPGLARRCMEHWKVLVFLAIASILEILPTLIIAAATSIFTDRILNGGDGALIRPVILTIAIASIASIIINVVSLYYGRRLSLGLDISLSTKFMDHLLHLPPSYYEQRSSGEVVSRTRLNDSVAEVISDEVVDMVNDVFSMVVYGAVMLLFSWKLTLIGIVANLAIAIVVSKTARRRVEANMALAMEDGKTSGIALEGTSAMEECKASGQENIFFDRWASAFARSTGMRQELAAVTLILNILPGILASMASIGVLLMGALEVINGAITIGELIAFQMLMGNFMTPMKKLSTFYADFQELQGELERLDDVLETPRDKCFDFRIDSATEASQNDRPFSGQLEFSDVDFRYSPVAPPLIEDFSLTITPGQRVALVGGSGSGKSTLAKLASGICQPEAGKILLDGRPREDWPPPLIAGEVAMVAQEIFLFEGTIWDNLTLWDPSVPKEWVEQACRDADIMRLIQTLPEGLHAKVEENGRNFSGGECQRLEIARALVNRPRLLILDEATSALDPETEKRIDQNLRLRGCSCLIVAHRLSTIRDSDEIIVLDGGQVVERGTHEQLWENQDGEYRQLYALGEELA